MLIGLFSISVFFLIMAGVSYRRKKTVMAVLFLLLGLFGLAVGLIAAYLYPFAMPF